MKKQITYEKKAKNNTIPGLCFQQKIDIRCEEKPIQRVVSLAQKRKTEPPETGHADFVMLRTSNWSPIHNYPH